jgi:hypothetical protein
VRPVGDGGVARLDTRGQERTTGHGFGQQRSTAREARRGRGVDAVGQRLYGAVSTGTWQARGNDVLTGGPGVGSGG